MSWKRETPLTNRIEHNEIARISEEFRAAAERWHHMSDANIISGRVTAGVKYRARAWAYEQASKVCFERLEKEREALDLVDHRDVGRLTLRPRRRGSAQ